MTGIEEKTISIIIPARDEEKFLPRCLASIMLAKTKIENPVEIIVVLNRCSDATESIALAAGCRTISCDAKNLAAIRNAGAKAASGEILATVDADSQLSPNMLSVILETLCAGEYVGGGVWIVPERISLGIIVTALLILPLIVYHNVFCGLFFCFKESFDAIGGFDEELTSLEDVDFGKRLKAYGKQHGKRYKNLLRASITTSCRKFDHFGDWYFVKRPKLLWSLLGGRDQKGADKVWYDFPR